MKIAHVLHNPAAGGRENSEEELISAIEAEGYKCSYLSTKEKGWEKMESEEHRFYYRGWWRWDSPEVGGRTP